MALPADVLETGRALKAVLLLAVVHPVVRPVLYTRVSRPVHTSHTVIHRLAENPE